MDSTRPYAEQVASNMLNRFGLAAIWQLQLAAARADREGNVKAAKSIAEIGDAAEREWQKRNLLNRATSAR